MSEKENNSIHSNKDASPAVVVVTQSFPPCSSVTCLVDNEERSKYADKPPCALSDRCVAACEAYGKVCPCAARIASHAACDAMKELTKDSEVFLPCLKQKDNNGDSQQQDESFFPHLELSDLQMKEKIGSGGFSNVNRCIVTAGPEKGREFAVKYLKKQAMVELHTFKHGAADLAVEAFFLHTLQHPNIVRLHAVTAGSIENNLAAGRECGFFLVVDLLTETLEQRIERYRNSNNGNGPLMSRIGLMGSEAKRELKEQLNERLQIALQIAGAMDYLHSKNIVFRDLKPDNIGFDKDGIVKIFDFGLAKELKNNLKAANGKYKLTGNTGSRRYMAPEVARDIAYDKSVDVYSFGILLWELCTAKKPFYGYSSHKHMQLVVLGGERPPMDSQYTLGWPQSLKWLVTHCWSSFTSIRPDFKAVQEILVNILNDKDCVPEHCAAKYGSEEPNVSSAPLCSECHKKSSRSSFSLFGRSSSPNKGEEMPSKEKKRNSWAIFRR